MYIYIYPRTPIIICLRFVVMFDGSPENRFNHKSMQFKLNIRFLVHYFIKNTCGGNVVTSFMSFIKMFSNKTGFPHISLIYKASAVNMLLPPFHTNSFR